MLEFESNTFNMNNILYRLVAIFCYVFFISHFSRAQDVHWTKINHFPDTNQISNSNKILQWKDTTYLFHGGAGCGGLESDVTYFSYPQVGKSTNGQDFKNLGRVESIVRPILIYKNKILLQDYYKGYQLLDDRLNYQDLGQNFRNQHFSIINDTLVMLSSCSFINFVSGGMGDIKFSDSLFYWNDTQNRWIGKSGTDIEISSDPFLRNFRMISTQNGFVLEKNGREMHTYSKIGTPKITPISKPLDFYDDYFNYQEASHRFIMGDYLITHHYPNAFKEGTNERPPFKRTNLKTFVTDYMPLPLGLDSADHYINGCVEHLIQALPDSTWLLRAYSSDFPDTVFYYRSTNNGSSWKLFNMALSDGSNEVVLEKIYQVGNRWFNLEGSNVEYRQNYATLGNNLIDSTRFWYSDNKGNTWHTTSLTGFRQTNSLVIRDGMMLLNNKYFSKDNGNTWKHYNDLNPNFKPDGLKWMGKNWGWMAERSLNNQTNTLLLRHLHDSLVVQSSVVPYSYPAVAYDGTNFTYKNKFYRISSPEYKVLLEYGINEGFGTFSFNFYQKADWQLEGIDDLKLLVSSDTLFALSYKYFDQKYRLRWTTDIKNWQETPINIVNKEAVINFNDGYDGQYLWNSDSSKIYKLTTKGLKPIAFNGLDPARFMTYINVFQLVKYPPNNLYYYYQLGDSVFLHLSHDEGQNWTRIATEEVKGGINGFGEDEIGNIYLSTNLGIYRTKIPEIATSISNPYVGTSNFMDGEILLFPNPTKGTFQISHPYSNGTLRIIGMDGVVHFSKQMESSHGQIDVSGLTSGLYMVEMGSVRKKLVVQ